MIRQALDEVRVLLGSENALIATLPADALLARIDQAPSDPTAEFRLCLPRLLELLVSNDLGSVDPWEVSRRLPEHDWLKWAPPLRAGVATVFDQWWATVLSAHPNDPPVDDVMATLVALELPLTRWLQPLLRSLDGPAARHLADIVTGRLSGGGWSEHEDERQQILAWCRTEPVVMGLTVVGGVHLPEGSLGDLLDLLL